MSDKRRSDDYKQISSYITLELTEQFKSIRTRLDSSQSDVMEAMTQEWIAKKTSRHSATSENADIETIAELVQANRAKLKSCGIKNLQALAKGEVLPTPGDFAIITSTLNLPEEERKKIWQKTFKLSAPQNIRGVKVYKDFGDVKEDGLESS